jgi:hypothetical protein
MPPSSGVDSPAMTGHLDRRPVDAWIALISAQNG